MNTVLRNIAIAATFAALLSLAACGGGGGSTVTASGLAKAQFIKQGDAICTRVHELLVLELQRKEKAAPGSMKKPANQQAFIKTIALPAVQREAEEIAALGAPAGDEGEVTAIVKGIEEGVKAAEADPGHASEAFTTVGEAAGKYGFKACSGPL